LHSPLSRTIPIPLPADQSTRPYWTRLITQLVWLAACVIPFLPFAVSTSPLDAVLLHVPGNQGNWWHFLAGLPFFLAFPVLWLSAQSLLGSKETPAALRLMTGFAAFSGVGTVLVEVPFLLHLAGTSAWQSFMVQSLGLGILLFSATVLILRRRSIPSLEGCIGSLLAAYLANASLCLVVYASSPGVPSTRIGWFITLALVWPMASELLWILARSSRPQG
jgi:hypothetical protein